MIKTKELYKKAIEKWGNALQIIMTFEEMSELTKELTKFFRGKKDVDKIAEEIGDVKIMLDQLEVMFDIEKDVKAHQLDKLQKLEEMLL